MSLDCIPYVGYRGILFPAVWIHLAYPFSLLKRDMLRKAIVSKAASSAKRL